MRIALCQINTRQGDLTANLARIQEALREAQQQRAELAVFPEMALCGYSPQDLLYSADFLAQVQTAEQQLIAECPEGIEVLCGSVAKNPQNRGRTLLNTVIHFRRGERLAQRAKSLLPNYDVFEEYRYFEPKAEIEEPLDIAASRCGVTICEDIWAQSDLVQGMPRYEPATSPPNRLKEMGCDWLVNLSASPYDFGKPKRRESMLVAMAQAKQLPIVMVNLVGGQDELIFDGNSIAIDAAGNILAQGPHCAEAVTVFELELDDNESKVDEQVSPQPNDDMEDLAQALVLGLRDYFHKTGFTKAILGLSGGIDSAITAAIAVEALGQDKVLGLAMPTRYSATMSLEDARELALNLGMDFDVIEIEATRDSFHRGLEQLSNGANWNDGNPDLMAENIQPRIRGSYLMAKSNRSGALLLNTGNKSETAVGYCTLYGDMCGAIAVIADLFKTDVYALARHWNATRGAPIPLRSIERPPSAELRENQTDQDSLPDYAILDDILARHIEQGQSFTEIQAAGHPEALIRRVLNLVQRNEYKRRQMPPGLRVSPKSFSVGRRFSISGQSIALPANPSKAQEQEN